MNDDDDDDDDDEDGDGDGDGDGTSWHVVDHDNADAEGEIWLTMAQTGR